MRLLVYYPQRLPYPTGVGGAVVTWALVRSAVERGHEVIVVSHNREGDKLQSKARTELQKLGVEVRLINSHLLQANPQRPNPLSLLRRMIWPKVEDFHGADIRASPALEAIVQECNPEAMYLYPVEAVIPTNRMQNVQNTPPRLAVHVNLGGTYFRRRLSPARSIRERLSNLQVDLCERNWDQFVAKELASCDLVISHAAHSAKWLREHGVPQCQYLSNPVVDAVGERWLDLRRSYESRVSTPKLLLVGSLLGTPQRASLKFLADDLLDELASRLKQGSYEVHIVGGGQLKSELAKRLDRPEVRIRGYVDDIAAEFLSSTVLLVPTPIDLGARTRIVEGFSFGCCVVTHSCDQKGMPEIEHEKNALVGSTPSEIADLVVRCLSDESLRKRLGRGARSTYEEKLTAEIVCGRMLVELERLSGQARAADESAQIISQPMVITV